MPKTFIFGQGQKAFVPNYLFTRMQKVILMSSDAVRFAMWLSDLNSLPEITVPPGYTLRTYRDGDVAAWCRIMSGQVGQWTVERFYTDVHDQPVFRPDGLFFAVHDDTPVATACAWWIPEKYGADVGILHMVATDPAHRSRGLGRAVSLSVIRFLAAQGMRACVLSTTSQRLAAIRLYLSLGVEPELDTPEIRALWPDILRAIGNREIAETKN